jgi:hypothetical protein
MDSAPSLSVLSIPPPPEISDEGEPMSLSDLPVPSDIETQDLEQDLEQALDDDYFPTEETGPIEGVTASDDPQEGTKSDIFV